MLLYNRLFSNIQIPSQYGRSSIVFILCYPTTLHGPVSNHEMCLMMLVIPSHLEKPRSPVGRCSERTLVPTMGSRWSHPIRNLSRSRIWNSRLSLRFYIMKVHPYFKYILSAWRSCKSLYFLQDRCLRLQWGILLSLPLRQ